MEGVHPFILPPTPDLLLKPSSLRIFFTLPLCLPLPNPYPTSSSHYPALSIFMLLLPHPLITLILSLLCPLYLHAPINISTHYPLSKHIFPISSTSLPSP